MAAAKKRKQMKVAMMGIGSASGNRSSIATFSVKQTSRINLRYVSTGSRECSRLDTVRVFVCVCERERETERNKELKWESSLAGGAMKVRGTGKGLTSVKEVSIHTLGND